MKDHENLNTLKNTKSEFSNSHAAGLRIISKVAKEMAKEKYYEVEFILHESLLRINKDQKIDKALIDGLSMKDINIIFNKKALKHEENNTVKIIFRYKSKEEFYIIASSLGNGDIIITDIDGSKVEISVDKPIIILKYKDRKNVISELSSILANKNLNIATMQVSRKKDVATLICELDSKISRDTKEKISNLKKMSHVKFIDPILG